MHVVESEVASAGFILNILHVMHKLTSKVDVQKVDINFLFHPTCRAKPGNETTFWSTQANWKPFSRISIFKHHPSFPSSAFG